MKRTNQSQATPRRKFKTSFGELSSKFGLIALFIVVVAIFSILKPKTYFSVLNLVSVGQQQAVTLLLALSVLMPLISGEFDLSVASIFGLSQLIIMGLMSRNNVNPLMAIILVIIGGALVGVINAIIIIKFQVSSFIATLGTSTILSGIALWYSGGEVIFANIPKPYLFIGQGNLFGIPLPIIYAIGFALIMWFILTYTGTGRRLYATGGNRTAARLSGIDNGRMILIAFTTCGAMAAATGVLISSELGSGQPLVGPSYLLPAYAGAFLGATTVTPGRFNSWGTVIAVYLLASGVTGLQQMGVPSWVEDIFNGGALITAVAVSGYVTRLRMLRRRMPEKKADVVHEGK